MSSLWHRLLVSLGLRKKSRKSRRAPSRADSRYTYERDETGRLIRHGPKGAERLSYESWRPLDSPEERERKRRRS